MIIIIIMSLNLVNMTCKTHVLHYPIRDCHIRFYLKLNTSNKISINSQFGAFYMHPTRSVSSINSWCINIGDYHPRIKNARACRFQVKGPRTNSWYTNGGFHSRVHDWRIGNPSIGDWRIKDASANNFSLLVLIAEKLVQMKYISEPVSDPTPIISTCWECECNAGGTPPISSIPLFTLGVLVPLLWNKVSNLKYIYIYI